MSCSDGNVGLFDTLYDTTRCPIHIHTYTHTHTHNFMKYSRLLQLFASMNGGVANDGMLSDSLTLNYKPPNGQHTEMLKSLSRIATPNTAAIAHTACIRGTSRDSFCVPENDKVNAVCYS